MKTQGAHDVRPLCSRRLLAIAARVPEGCGTVADVGADHGELSAHLLASGRCGRVIVSDISPASLMKARRLFGEMGSGADVREERDDGSRAMRPVSAGRPVSARRRANAVRPYDGQCSEREPCDMCAEGIQLPVGANCVSPPVGVNCVSPPVGTNCVRPPVGENCVSPPVGANCVSPPVGANCVRPPVHVPCPMNDIGPAAPIPDPPASDPHRPAACPPNVRFAVSDGLSHLSPGEADVLVIAGMGSERIAEILAAGLPVAHKSRLILQPNVDAEPLRRYLAGNGFRIADEDLVYENRRFYAVIVAEAGEEAPHSPLEWSVGWIPLRAKRPEVLALLRHRERVWEKALGEAEGEGSGEGAGPSLPPSPRALQLRTQLDRIREAIQSWTP